MFDEPWLVVDVLVNDAGPRQSCRRRRPSTAIRHARPRSSSAPAIIAAGRSCCCRMRIPARRKKPEQVWKLLSKWLDAGRCHAVAGSKLPLPCAGRREWRRGRIFLAGDAAHQQPPFIGQGMCQGLRDVSKSDLEARPGSQRPVRRCSARHLRGGAQRACSPAHDPDQGYRQGDLRARSRSGRERDARILAEGGGQPRTITRQEIVPPLQKGLLASPPIKAHGTLFPQPWVRTAAGRNLLDAVAGAGWRLFIDGRNSPDTSPDVEEADRPGLHAADQRRSAEPSGSGRSRCRR